MSDAGVPAVDDADTAHAKVSEEVPIAKNSKWPAPIPFDYEAAAGGGAVKSDCRETPPWLSDAVVYAWDDEFGDVGLPNERLEKELFQSPDISRAGFALDAFGFDVDVGGPDKVAPVRAFEDAGLHPLMMENVKLCQYKVPTPIQAYCIPAVLTGHDIVGIAQTGSGKTAAFLIPILSRLMGKARVLAAPRPNPVRYNPATDRVRAEPLVLIVCPTRELACQIFDEARRLCYRTMLRPCVIYGGAPFQNQREQLEMGCDVLVATPGRLVDFMRRNDLLSLSRLKFTVIDEADEMLSTGWEEAMEKIFQGSDNNADADHIYLMFSATFPKAARKLVRQYMEDDYVDIKVGRVGSTHRNIKQKIVFVEDRSKNQALLDLINSMRPQRTLVFVNAKTKCDVVDDFLFNKGLPTTSLHADRTQREREDALRSFRTGRAPILIATGVTARGLDVASVGHVINYDLPSAQHSGITEYVHRIGRTARIGNEGIATSFYNERNEDIAEDLVKLLLESKQEVPDFLQDKMPADPSNIEWHDGTDDESDAGGDASSGGFGGADTGFNGQNDDTNVGWGGERNGFGNGFTSEADNKMTTW